MGFSPSLGRGTSTILQTSYPRMDKQELGLRFKTFRKLVNVTSTQKSDSSLIYKPNANPKNCFWWTNRCRSRGLGRCLGIGDPVRGLVSEEPDRGRWKNCGTISAKRNDDLGSERANGTECHRFGRDNGSYLGKAFRWNALDDPLRTSPSKTVLGSEP